MSRKNRLENIFVSSLKPWYIEVEDESAKHHVPEGAQTHFRIVMVADIFVGQSRLERHKFVHSFLKNEFAEGLHALSLQLYTPQEWEKRKIKVSRPSPACLDGYDKIV